MKPKFLFILLIVLLAISSCQKEVDFSLPPKLTSGNDSIYLQKLIELDTTSVPGADTLFIKEFYYDNLKRLIRTFEKNSSSPLNTIYFETKYYYTGSDTLPYKTTEIDNEGAVIYNDTILYTFNNGKVSRDSFIFYRQTNGELLGTSTQTYVQVAPNNIFVKSRHVSYTTGFPRERKDSGNAIVSLAGSNIISQSAPFAIANSEVYNLTYDNKVNPVYRTDIHYLIYGGFNNSLDNQKNNPLDEEIGNTTGGTLYHFKSNYVYRSDGYPLIKRTNDLLDPSYSRKTLYFYTSL